MHSWLTRRSLSPNLPLAILLAALKTLKIRKNSPPTVTSVRLPPTSQLGCGIAGFPGAALTSPAGVDTIQARSRRDRIAGLTLSPVWKE